MEPISGEGFALLASLAYGLAGVAIFLGKKTARGDNGIFLSVLVTATLTGILWLGWGQVSAKSIANPDMLASIAIFVLAGLFSTVLGRMTMYRATEQIGPVTTALLRRLTPVFALPIAFIFLAEIPDGTTAFGAALVLISILVYLMSSNGKPDLAITPGLLLGIGSAAFYATSYTLRSYGLDRLPDAALGTCIGALAGIVWFVARAATGPNRPAALAQLLVDRGPWHWVAALALSAGQTFQFFALKSASVVVVATLGSLEVFFTAAFGAILIGTDQTRPLRLLIAGTLAMAGTLLLMW